METRRDSNVIVVRLMDGEMLLPSLEEAAKIEGIGSAIVTMGIGMLRNLTLGYFEEGKYKRTDFKEPHELVSLQGSYAKCDEDMIVHLHGIVGDKEHRTFGGHVFGGEVCGIAEITILNLDPNMLYRKLNPVSGLKELHVR
jgi:predicted DNA-binding protein with PD1-like motif